jgi:hypothetical protein
MHKHIQILAIAMLLVSQVAKTTVQIPATDIAEAASQAVSTPKTTYNLKVNIGSTSPVEVVAKQPSFDNEVLAPLQAAQAAKAKADAEAVAQKAATVIRLASVQVDDQSNKRIGVATGDVWEQLRLCEAGGDYTRNSGNGYYGAYQYNLGTWANYGGYASPHLAPPEVQDAKARITQAARGWSPWPACARKLGLL